MSQTPQWHRSRDMPRVCLHPPNLRSTILVAMVVGTVLFGINQLDVVLSGQATAKTWLKAGLTYVVPFVVANYGLLLGARATA